MLEINYFNPVVEDWTPANYERELKEKEECDFCLYTLTPKMTEFYSIAEAVDDSNKHPKKIIFCILDVDYEEKTGEEIEWSRFQKQSLDAISKMIIKNGGKVFYSLEETADYLNEYK